MKRVPQTPVIGVILLVLLALAAFLTIRQTTRTNRAALNPNTIATNALPPVTASRTTNSGIASAASTPSPDFQKRPYPISYETPEIQWTSADGKDTNVIQQLAHNPLEYDRMVQENPRLLKRQLVYLKETAAAVFERAKLTRATVQELTVPGLDGQEFRFQIIQSDSNGSSRHGMFSGRLVGNPDSMVTMAFQDGREAFTVISPKENIFIEGEPREPGQVIVKAFDPNTYGTGPQGGGDDFIKTQPAPN
jgi:hypothetical protein